MRLYLFGQWCYFIRKRCPPVSYRYSFEDLLALLHGHAPAKVDAVALHRRRVEHGHLSVGLKIHCLGDGSKFSTWGRTRYGATLWETSRHPLRKTTTTRAADVWCSTMQRGTSTEILIGGRNLASIVLWSPNCHSQTAAAICSLAAAAGWTSRTSTCLPPFSSMLSTKVTGTSSACSSRRRWKHC